VALDASRLNLAADGQITTEAALHDASNQELMTRRLAALK
jgi:hypothetical protein